MHGIEVDWSPSHRKLRQFAVLWLLFFGLMAYWQRVAGNEPLAVAIFVAAFLGGSVGWIAPPVLRPIYVSWMIVAYPIGWVISHFSLAVLYFGLFTPIAILFKCLGRDALALRPQLDRKTYWIPAQCSADVRRYFRPY